MSENSAAVRFLYGTCPGRLLLKLVMGSGLDRAFAAFLRSPYSRFLIPGYVKRHGIDMEQVRERRFRSFGAFFARKDERVLAETTPDQLISPCDGWLSVSPVDRGSCFLIKGSHYKVADLLTDEELGAEYDGGLCLIFRLCASDYHHYCFIDDGYQGVNHPIPGELHSVQPIACENYPVFTRNRRSWCLLATRHFGPVVQMEIGALVVGGIINDLPKGRFRKGYEKGHFELAGSTIVLLFREGKLELREEILEALESAEEVRVQQGDWIGCATGSRYV